YGTSHRINFLGPIFKMDDKIKLFSEHDALVLPSSREAMPQALIEAMAAGLIVISSKTDGGKELIRHGENGYLFEINDSNGLTDLLKNYKNNDLVKTRAREFAKQFKNEVLGEKLLNLYKEN
ncbi:MAG: glycosyltransferase, partial [Nanoarchaeota archaeon]